MNFIIKNEDIQSYNESDHPDFPKYTSQLINWANQNAQGTRPKVVGQLSELFPQFISETDDITIQNWEEWYLRNYPNAIDIATEKIYTQVKNLQEAIPKITKSMVHEWVRDLIITKTYNGLYVQKAILARLATIKKSPYKLSSPDEESRGIDGYVGNVAYSIKPDTYKTMGRLSENIEAKMIYYTKTKTGLKIEVED